MVKLLPSPRRTRQFCCAPRRAFARRIIRRATHSCLRPFAGYRRRPDDLAQALTAFTRAIRAHRRLARFAPEFFDSTEINRLEQLRKEDAEWRAMWEPALKRIYRADHVAPPPDPSQGLPSRPKCSRTRRAVERELASLRFWMSAGSLALATYERRRSYALPSLSRVARLLKIGFEFADLACGEPVVPDTAGHEQARADLERIYGDHTRVAREPEDRLQVNQ